MLFKEITFLRLQTQQISYQQFTQAADLVRHLGAVQSQDFNMALWALGVRLPGSSQNTIEAAINKGKILRTHVLRPTWHFVYPDDIGWMLDLTSRSLRSVMNARNKQLGLTAKVFLKSNSLIEKALSENGPLTREELMEMLQRSNINTSENRSSHLLYSAEIDKLICSGPMKNKKTTYTLYSAQVKKNEKLEKEEALSRLAVKYFKSHGPATIKDFSWWGGINQRDARIGTEASSKNLQQEKISGETYWIPRDLKLQPFKKTVHFLPAYDEFTISYKDRTPSLHNNHRGKIISVNGIFNPLIIIEGQVAGMWKRSSVKDNVSIQLEFFEKPGKKKESIVWEEAEKYAAFFGKKLIRK